MFTDLIWNFINKKALKHHQVSSDFKYSLKDTQKTQQPWLELSITLHFVNSVLKLIHISQLVITVRQLSLNLFRHPNEIKFLFLKWRFSVRHRRSVPRLGCFTPHSSLERSTQVRSYKIMYFKTQISLIFTVHLNRFVYSFINGLQNVL